MSKQKIQRDSMVFYKSFYEAIRELEPVQQAEVYNAIFEFGLNGKEPNSNEVSSTTKTIFRLIKPQIIANNARYANGQKGGRPRKEETEGEPNDDESHRKGEPNQKQNKTKVKPNKNQTETKQEPNHNQDRTKAKPNENDNVNVNDNVNGNDKVNVKEKGSVKGKTIGVQARGTHHMIKPTVAEIQAYCDERGNDVDAQRFFDFYESKGWLVGKTPMKDWKACVRTWERQSKQHSDRQGSDGNWTKTLADL